MSHRIKRTGLFVLAGGLTVFGWTITYPGATTQGYLPPGGIGG